MQSTSFNQGWKYWKDTNSFALVWDVPKEAGEVTLPHDAMLEEPARAESRNGGNTGYRDGAAYTYVKLFYVEKVWERRTLLLKFDGVYMNAMVYVNGELAGKCPYGYSGFFVPLNDYLNFGEENELRVIVRNGAMPNSRWYSGGGIYRDVWLLTGEETYLVPEGMLAVTELLTEDTAVVRVRTAVKNRSSLARRLRLVTELIDREGETAAVQEQPFVLYQGEERTVTGRMTVRNPRTWSERDPYLYRVRTRLFEGDTLVDESLDTTGIRTLSADPVNGLLVNGRTVKLRGACIHHDSGILGAATFYDAEYRRVRILKEAGFNAIRMAHHPAAPVLLQACDELGMYVMDEGFDMWTRCKSDHDYGLFFTEWWERDVEAMVRKDYNHPSVILYSVGNEIPEIGTGHGARICQSICDKIRQMDPSRYTLAAVNGVFAAGDLLPKIMADLRASGKIAGNVNEFMGEMGDFTEQVVTHEAVTQRLDMACAGADIAGYNYMAARYESDGKQRPNRVIVGSETNPPKIAGEWGLVKRLPHVIGDFTWTGWDYIGEAGVGVPSYRMGEGGFGAAYPCQLAYCGDVDITGFRRPLSYLREIVFGLRREPYLVVQNPDRYGEVLRRTPWILSDAVSSWTYPGREGKPVIVEVYAPGDTVELFLNGRSLGKKESGERSDYRTLFEVTYEPGLLEAVSYEEDRPTGRAALETADEEGELSVTVEKGHTGELVFVSICHQDRKGNVITNREARLSISAEGAAGFFVGSGDPNTRYPYTGTETQTWHGRALAVVRKEKKEDTVRVLIDKEGNRVSLEV